MNASRQPDAATRRRLAEAVRNACFEAAREASEDAGIRGVCAEGQLDLALDAIRSLELGPLLDSEIAPAPREP